MTSGTDKDRSHESVINDTLARFLRERCSLSAVAETLHGSGRPDIIVRLSEGPVILETGLEPALTVEADALSRLGMEIAGQKVPNVFAVTVPGRLRSTGQQHLYERSLTGRPGPVRRWPPVAVDADQLHAGRLAVPGRGKGGQEPADRGAARGFKPPHGRRELQVGPPQVARGQPAPRRMLRVRGDRRGAGPLLARQGDAVGGPVRSA